MSTRNLKLWGLAEFVSSSDNECTQEAEEEDCKTLDNENTFSVTGAPGGVSGSAWEKFRELSERREKEATHRPKRKRRRKSNAMKTSDNEKREKCCIVDLTTHEDSADENQKGNVKKMHCTEAQGKLPHFESPRSTDETEQNWTEVKKYFEINSHLNGVDPGRHASKTGLEKLIDKAVELGEFELAEQYSEELATRDFAVKVSKAFDCVKYIKRKSKEIEKRDKKKKKKLQWGFDGKHRWETKSNM
ncbi:protein FAM204A-like [Corticium candelabrum]|uniref:protein FAM204A-like n=1 Tax=Corticium candelabrum TaxID=121492 RepID=UPI002E25341C|nr:protein FAM204A-like [Corticium candelabrum]